ncbi:nickel transporter permease [Ammoniphilus sp. CFH 90114]|uniref:nickel transporter permease n=1 Tax=Ammoniphilus sp. CFH 90114 TaxID=2493665 RepID=UPI00100E1767|nr:nickel transporter permease [Ammoniphilus sp. CFH 90114]RXT03814.1 ABC transporter permease subunit [Ammoniphilus sp. CFH 90114]
MSVVVIRRKKWSTLLQFPSMMMGICLMAVILMLTWIGPYLLPNDPLTVQMSERLQPSSWQYPLGTDHMGRCILSRLLAGAHITLGVSALVIFTVMMIGIPLGLLSGYVGGRLDALLMRFVDGLAALPEFIWVIAVSGFLGPSLTNMVFSIVMIKWIGYARVVRGIVLSEREKEYVLAARVAGTGTAKILWRHLFPQIISPVAVLAALDIGKIILIISSLSYLGLGAQPPTPEWGAMLNDGRPYFQTIPELMIYPGVAIMLVVISCNLIGDGLRDYLDVRSR